MSTIHMRDIELHTFGELPEVGQAAPDFTLATKDLDTVTLSDFAGKAMLLNVYPSVDTKVCFESVKTFSQEIVNRENLIVACISMDLPFALKRVASSNELENIVFLSDYRNRDFGGSYGLTIADGPIAGMLARAVIVLDSEHRVVYHELVEDITNPPDYEKALSYLS